ncbi:MULTISPECIES: FeoA family protein [Bacillus]|uniref:FeoA family protein n=1 Tax=Bacillus TaxID=1386 RepID=UPI0002DC2A35|nr:MULTISPECIES: FeoA family protein [Bacillus]
MTKLITLDELAPGEKMTISSLHIDDNMRRRLLDLGFVPGFTVEMLSKSPLGDPVAYRVSGTTIALRKEESKSIFGERVIEND